MSDKRLLQELRRAVGCFHDVGLADVGGWIGAGELARAGFWDARERRARSFAGVEGEAGRLTWWEVADEAGCQAVAA
jgi:hypothetical protein